MQVTLDGHSEHFEFEGPTLWGESALLLEGDEDLLKNCPWRTDGYTIAPLFKLDEFESVALGIHHRLKHAVEDFLSRKIPSFELEKYHTYATEIHAKVMAFYRFGLPLSEFPIPKARLERRISELLGSEVTTAHPSGLFDRFHLRIVRPKACDFNPLHRDAWLDRLRHGINLYIPIAGSNALSSLPLVPGSHLWKESELCRTEKGARMNGLDYTVPSVVDSRRPLELTRPNPGRNEVLMFSPYLLHGFGLNRNADTTRVSLEIRLWKKR